MENISVMFAKPDKRASWEESFNEAKQKLGRLHKTIVLKKLRALLPSVTFQYLNIFMQYLLTSNNLFILY